MTEGMKPCKYCGREVGADTNFCWFCGRELEARPERPEPAHSESKFDRWLLIGLATAATIVLVLLLVNATLR